MKTVIVQGDGIVSQACSELDGQTPLQVAKTPHLDELANTGEFGVLTTTSEGRSLSSAVIHVALLGYDPSKYSSGLGPFEAASLDVVLEKNDVAFLCHFVTLDSMNGRGDHKKMGSHQILLDAAAGGIDTEEARELIDLINEQLGSETIQFYTGEQHRHVMVWIGGTTRCDCYNPRVAQGRSLEAFLPSGNGAEVVKELMEASRPLLRHHSLNQEREKVGLKPANCLWLWGPGKSIELPNWQEKNPIPSITISQSGIHRGIAQCAGVEVSNPQDLIGDQVLSFREYAQSCLGELDTKDFVYVHVPMPYFDRTVESSVIVHAIERFDEELIGPLMNATSAKEDFRLLVVGNHNDEEAKGLTVHPTPYALLEKKVERKSMTLRHFNEIQATQGSKHDVTRLAARLLATKIS